VIQTAITCQYGNQRFIVAPQHPEGIFRSQNGDLAAKMGPPAKIHRYRRPTPSRSSRSARPLEGTPYFFLRSSTAAGSGGASLHAALDALQHQRKPQRDGGAGDIIAAGGRIEPLGDLTPGRSLPVAGGQMPHQRPHIGERP
jgi:hypothetical protein